MRWTGCTPARWFVHTGVMDRTPGVDCAPCFSGACGPIAQLRQDLIYPRQYICIHFDHPAPVQRSGGRVTMTRQIVGVR